jgi:hypothetical protein
MGEESTAGVVGMDPESTARIVGLWFRNYQQDLRNFANALTDGNGDPQGARTEGLIA